MASSFNELYGLGSHSPDARLQGWWPCMDNAASTTVVDYSGKGRHGTATRNTSLFSASGPNSWLTASLDFDGSADWVSLGDYRSDFSNKASVSAIVNPDIAGAFPCVFSAAKAGGDGSEGFELRLNSNTGRLQFNADETTGRINASAATSTVGVWSFACGVYDGSGVTINDDGVISSTVSASGNIAFGASGASWRIGDRGTVGGFRWNGRIANPAIWSGDLSSTEQGQVKDGPEPICSSAPTLSGTETEGQTLTCANGTWGLPSPFASGSNGTITYARQWTRSNDGSGSGEADIGGATSSTYTLQAGDVGKYIRCRVRATNDGGFDSAADTNSAFTGAIAAAGGGARRGDLLLLGVGA